ncbi:hypothetical protein N7489_002500 [Penicillium chrysogenum]|uniref:Uncharacterized protein n=1 Tax=Penicillium chrysogenum TaxID=5076 RepID=A0ABQ8WLS4_PENCH|nr:uncharacterized protein N7489_002500 [Penicillium chrysogenum]KAJ5248173.1 hypothetical protein N7524_012133 [Penicillium chrysogenum]KAJ5252090.1 hypothetical protein N7489_002500 [Penicillium chrysogenum]KAJ5270995.1 hypothetical protein N7505_006753 [Penicillium chrysogenum]KAJ6146251.1 hypothetical protein N7497_008233 [Penicillium chrysogenum]
MALLQLPRPPLATSLITPRLTVYTECAPRSSDKVDEPAAESILETPAGYVNEPAVETIHESPAL